jgi:hypothetical protein
MQNMLVTLLEDAKSMSDPITPVVDQAKAAVSAAVTTDVAKAKAWYAKFSYQFLIGAGVGGAVGFVVGKIL